MTRKKDSKIIILKENHRVRVSRSGRYRSIFYEAELCSQGQHPGSDNPHACWRADSGPSARRGQLLYASRRHQGAGTLLRCTWWAVVEAQRGYLLQSGSHS